MAEKKYVHQLMLDKNDAVLLFSKHNEDGSQYGIELHMPKRDENGELMPYEYLLAGIAMFIQEKKNVDLILEYFDSKVKEVSEGKEDVE